ncbi:MAG: hypothetical protein SF029_03875 [bacterium]|nr:hypothetical protein [bacterium]
MSDIYDRIVSERGSFERLIARIPGFRGYQEKQARRTADEMLRKYTSDLIRQRLDRFIRIEQLIINNGGLAYMTRTRNVKSKLQQLKDKIDTASPGYSGMWAQLKIDTDEMERLYAFDEAQIRHVEAFDTALDAIEHAAGTKEGLDEAIVQLDMLAVDALNAYELRDDVINNFSQEHGS